MTVKITNSEQTSLFLLIFPFAIYASDVGVAGKPAASLSHEDAELHRSACCYEDDYLAASARARHRVGVEFGASAVVAPFSANAGRQSTGPSESR
jgi:hypothetical protein